MAVVMHNIRLPNSCVWFSNVPFAPNKTTHGDASMRTMYFDN